MQVSILHSPKQKIKFESMRLFGITTLLKYQTKILKLILLDALFVEDTIISDDLL